MENNRGNHFSAALEDFAGNLVIGSVPKAIMGMAVILPYPWVAYQGWIGGIVSVRSDHSSRLNSLRSAAYYLLTLVLQILPYSLSVGAGVNVGISLFRPAKPYQERSSPASSRKRRCGICLESTPSPRLFSFSLLFGSS